MKKLYITPVLDMCTIAVQDVIRTSTAKGIGENDGTIGSDPDRAPSRNGVPANPIRLQPNALEH